MAHSWCCQDLQVVPNETEPSDLIRTYQAAFDAFDVDKFEEALRLIDQVLELRPKSGNSWALRGRALYQLGDLPEAIASSEKSVELKPSCHHAWATLGLVHRDNMQFERSASCFQPAADLSEDKSILTVLAAVEYQFDPESARRHAEEALALDPDWDEARAILKTATEKISKAKNEPDAENE